MPDRRRIVALLLPAVIAVSLVAVPARPVAAATTLSCVEYLPGALICSPPDTPDGLLYTTYDRSGQATTPGSYAFLDEAGDVVTTYEGLRDGTATGLRLHTTDADGAALASVHGEVAVGDIFEWRKADDCFVRYTVTEVKPDPAGTAPRKHLAIEWMTYAFTGCTGAIAANTAASFAWGPLPDLGGTSLTAPIRHALWQIVPEGWTGATEASRSTGGDFATPVYVETIAEARLLPRWREPDLPSEWVFWRAGTDPTVTPFGYEALWGTGQGTAALYIRGEQASDIAYVKYAAGRRDGKIGVHETRIIAGRPALARYSPAGPTEFPLMGIVLSVYDPDTNTEYTLYGTTKTLRGGNIDAMIAIAESLFAE